MSCLSHYALSSSTKDHFYVFFFPWCLSFQALLSEAEITLVLKRLRCVMLLKPTHSPFRLFLHLKVQPLFPIPFTIPHPFFILPLFCHTFAFRYATAVFFFHTHKFILGGVIENPSVYFPT